MLLLDVGRLVLVMGVVTMSLMAIGIAVFVVAYQRKFTRQQLAYQRRLLETSLKAQEQERAYISRELHDGIGAMLSATKLLVHRLPEPRPDVRKDLEETLTQTIHEVRTLSRGLSPLPVKRGGLGHALDNYCRLMNGAEGVEVNFVNENVVKSTNLRDELSLYRIAQELIHNAIRHAHATHITVRLSIRQDYLSLQVEDNGQGFNLEATGHSGSGLLNVRSRLHLLQGSIRQDTSLRSGTCLTVRVPLHLFT